VVEMLDSHPEVCCGYELLIPQWKDPCGFVGHKNIRTCHSAVGKAITSAALRPVPLLSSYEVLF
jgi:hypothetical protein